jgi:AcrR family transcriptional regulator
LLDSQRNCAKLLAVTILPQPAPARRDRVRQQMRQQTLDEIEQHAFEIIDAGGLQELSIAALAKAMGMSAPALYRYFPSRDALVEALVVAAYASLGSAVDAAARAAHSREPAERVMAIAHAYRRWALAYPRRYSMLFSDRGPGETDPPAGIAAINVGMLALLAALQEISPADDSLTGGTLGQQLVRWGRKTGADPSAGPAVLRLGVLLWSRVHGLVSLELCGALDSMGIDGELLLTSEVQAVTRNGS